MKRDIRGELSGILPDDLVGLVPRSFDVIGSKGRAVAVVEVPSELEPYGQAIGEALMRVQRNVQSVLSKGTERMGEFRVRDMKLLAGDPDTEVLHKESGCVFKVDPAKAYFSPRESTEREKVSSKVAPGERVLVMFSGIGPFAICIAKRQPTAQCVAVELNPDGHAYCLENIRLNKVNGRVKAVMGDVRVVCPALGEIFDRVLMPLPKGAYEFLDVAIPMVKPGGVLHFYHWAPRDDPFTDGERILVAAAGEFGRNVEVLERVRVSQYSPSAWKIRIDARVG
ncbi:MAG: class I SAM-dependent methyltransferase family protein [Candidatus Bathyarchaeota archaeon]|nr:class I SAM-dependent methyltransferase family protein [Candidatus Bathyarchaeota archaeon]